MQPRTLFSALALFALFFPGCASGPASARYSALKGTGALQPQSGKALVLVYFKPYLGSINVFQLYANGQLLTDSLRPGTFYAYQAAPGRIQLGSKKQGSLAAIVNPFDQIHQMTHIKEQAAFDVTAGETYYVQAYIPFSSRLNTKLVPAAEGENGIRNCALINP
jgi:hypothetical protein